MLYHEYFEKVNKQLEEALRTQSESIDEAAHLIADSVKNGGIFHVFGCGHSQMYAMEVFYRAGGLVPVNAILTPAFSLEPKAPLSTHGERIPGFAPCILENESVKEGDVLFVASTSARNNVPIEMVIEAKKRGVKVIVLYSSSFSESVTSRHVSGKKANELADVVLDNCGVSGDAVMELPGMRAKFGPTSSVVGFTLLQSTIVQAVGYMHESGMEVPVWVSANLDQGDAINQKYIDTYRSRISCL